MIHKKSERGQALVLIVFAIVALIGLTGLAIDGGNAYSDRRNAQNAADTAALAAALSKVQGASTTTWESVGAQRAASNGYAIDNSASWVRPCTDPSTYCGAYAGNAEYLQVQITSHVKAYFAPVLGFQEFVNVVTSIAHAKPSVNAPMFGGDAIVAIDPNGCKAINYTGGANMTITGSGIFANSTCSTAAFYNSSSTSATLTTPCLTTVGGYTYSSGKVVIDPPNPNCPSEYTAAQYSSSYYTSLFPTPVCTGTATTNGSTMTAGTFTGNFPPNNVTTLQPGIYCVNGNFSLNSNQTLSGSGVVIYMQSGKVTWNANSNPQLSAPQSGPYQGLLLYASPSNSSSVTINGGSNSVITGTIFAPASTVTINGGGTVGSGIQSQIIGYDVNLAGNSATTINYDAAQNFNPPLPPQLELTR